jgi:hypothetical protein
MRWDSSDEPRRESPPERRGDLIAVHPRELDVEEDVFGEAMPGEHDGPRAVAGDRRVVADEPDHLGRTGKVASDSRTMCLAEYRARRSEHTDAPTGFASAPMSAESALMPIHPVRL